MISHDILVYLVIDQENVGSSPGTIHFKRCYLLSYNNVGKAYKVLFIFSTDDCEQCSRQAYSRS